MKNRLLFLILPFCITVNSYAVDISSDSSSALIPLNISLPNSSASKPTGRIPRSTEKRNSSFSNTKNHFCDRKKELTTAGMSLAIIGSDYFPKIYKTCSASNSVIGDTMVIGLNTYLLATFLSPLWLPALRHLSITKHSDYVQRYHDIINRDCGKTLTETTSGLPYIVNLAVHMCLGPLTHPIILFHKFVNR